MPFDELKNTVGRQPYRLLELDMDYCPLRFGEGPCEARLGLVSLSNLVTYSQAFDSWTADSVTVAPDAQLSPISRDQVADYITETADPGVHTVTRSVAIAPDQVVPSVFSVFARRETGVNSIFIEVEGLGQSFFNIRDGSAGLRSSNVQTRIVEASQGYYLCSVFFTPLASGTVDVTVGTVQGANTTDFIGDPGNRITLFGAQWRRAADANQYVLTLDTPVFDQQATEGKSQKCFNTRATCQDVDNYIGKATGYNGAAYHEVQPSADFADGTSYSIELYVQPYEQRNGPLFIFGGVDGTGPRLWVFKAGEAANGIGGSLFFHVGELALDDSYFSSSHAVLTDPTRWFHVVATMDEASSIAKLYVDGVVVGEMTLAVLPRPRTGGVTIGYDESNGSDYFYTGGIGRVRFHNTALTQAQVRRAFGNSALKTSAIMDLPMDRPPSGIILDSNGGSAHTATEEGTGHTDIAGPLVTKTYAFGEDKVTVPPASLNILPCLTKVSTRPAVVTPGSGIGVRASVKMELRDFPHHDIGIDKYVDERDYVPYEQGSFFGKFLARNPFYTGRNARLLSGYVNDIKQQLAAGATFESFFQERRYIMDGIDGPNAKRRVQFTAKDILKFVDDDKAVAPVESIGRLAADMTDTATSFTMDPNDAEGYPEADFRVRVDDEIMLVATRVVGTFSGITREVDGSIASEHATDDSVQLCLRYEDVNVVDILFDLFVTYGRVSPSVIPLDAWDAERLDKLSNYQLTTTITHPVGVKKLIEELCLQCLLNVYWDEVNSVISMKSLLPTLEDGELISYTARANVLSDSISIKRKPKDRVSRMLLYYGLRDYAGKLDVQNVRFIYAEAALSTEGDDQYRGKRIEEIFSRWFNVNNRNQAIQTGSRLLARLQVEPFQVQFSVDAKDSNLGIGDHLLLVVDEIQDSTGQAAEVALQVVSVLELDQKGLSGSHYTILAQNIFYAGRESTSNFARIAPNSQVDFLAANATERERYGFIADINGEMSNNTPGYSVL